MWEGYMDKQMNLQESLQSALNKMKNAKEAYEWLKRNGDTSDSREQTRQFDIFKEISTVPDILLRCFVFEKKIPCFESKFDKATKKYEFYEVDVQNLTTVTYAHKVCSSILYYNALHPSMAYLEDVDFGSFFDDAKEIRNMNTHIGVPGALQDVYRIFKNLNKILLALDCNKDKEIVQLSEETGTFDFPQFYACMDDMNADERKFILITDSLHDINHDELASFLKIPWSLVIDFDGSTNYGGFQSVMEEQGIQYNKFLEEEFTVNNTIAYIPGRIMYIALCDDSDFRKGFRARGKKVVSGEKSYISAAVRKVRNTRTKGTVVIAGAQNNRIRDIINYIAEEFKELDVLYLVHQEGKLIEKTDDEDWDETGNIASVITFNNSIFESMRRIHVNDGLLPQREGQSIATDGAIYCVQISGIGKMGLNDLNLIQRIEQDFEVVHLDIGKNQQEINEWQFFHGDSASWATIRYGNLPVLSKKVENFEKTIQSSGYNNCFCLYHAPGIGGSTLGKQICWRLSQNMPVLVVKKYSNSQNFKKCLNDIYIYLFNKYSFMILVDENLFSESEMQDMLMAVQETDSRVNALFVKRISEEDARLRYKNQNDRELLFTKLEPEEKEQLKSRCFELLQSREQEYRYVERVKSLEKNIAEKERFALLINLYLLEENFKLETYVGGFLKQIPDDIDGKKIKDLLIYTAICAYFSNNVKIPVSYYSSYLAFGQKVDYINNSQQKSSVEKIFKIYEEGLLLKITDKGNKWYGVKHFLIAEEMLRQLMGGGHWESCLPDYSYKLIDMLYSLSAGLNEVDEVIRNIITALFTDRTRDRVQGSYGDFTALLEHMDDPAKLDIILYLADCFGKLIRTGIPTGEQRPEYKLLAHIYAQCARVRSRCLRVDEDKIDEAEVDHWIEETKKLILEEGIFEYDLEDMLGRCYLDRVKRAVSVNEWNEEKVIKTLQKVDKAITHFSATISYGSASYGIPGKLESIWRGIGIIKQWRGWGEESLIDHLYGDLRAKEYLEMGYEVIREADEYEMTTLGYVRMLQQKEQFEQIYGSLESSKLIENLENLRSQLDPKDYHSQYIVSSGMVNEYERKYYTESSEYRRSQLLYNALNGNKKAKEDAEKVFAHLELLIKLSTSHEVSYTTYKCWFEYAKYLDVSLQRAWDVAMIWKNQEVKRARTNSLYDNNLIKPYYYLFVIALLRYKSGQGMTGQDVLDRKKDLNDQIKSTSRSTSVVQDWYAKGKGMGQLYDRSWIKLADVDSESRICIVSGTVVHFENNWGYIKLSSPRAMGSWAKSPIGQRYSKDCDVFFDGRQSGIISEIDVGSGQTKQLKVGFSYERMVASTKSLERNIKKSSFVEDESKSKKSDRLDSAAQGRRM